MEMKMFIMVLLLVLTPALASAQMGFGRGSPSSFVDDAAFTLTTSSLMVGGGIRDDSLTTLAVTEGDAIPFRFGSTGALHVTGAAGVTEFAEDDIHSTGASGNLALTVRNDTLGALAGTDGDYAVLQVDADGALYVNVARGGGQVDDAAFTPGTDSGMPAFGMFDDVNPDSVNEGDVGAVRMSSDRILYTRFPFDPCSGVVKSYFVVDVVNNTLVDIATAASGDHVYICAINLVTNAANNVAIVEDTTTLCASPTAGLAGGTTAAEGWNFAANGGLTLGNGSATIMRTATVNHYVCLAASASTQLSGHIAYVQAP